jgi:AbrB family looped-hinge helix DNA binding protein
MRVTSKGQVTIPVEVRDQLGIHPGDEVEIVAEEGSARIVKSNVGRSRGQRVVDRLRGSGTANLDMSTDEIMALMRGD